jgi:hypothetical protein
MKVEQLLEERNLASCPPWHVGDRTWLAACPTCRAAGRDSLVEIRETDDGEAICCCINGHEAPRQAA